MNLINKNEIKYSIDLAPKLMDRGLDQEPKITQQYHTNWTKIIHPNGLQELIKINQEKLHTKCSKKGPK